MLNPPIDLLNETELAAVIEIMREVGDLGRAERELRGRFPQWDMPRPLGRAAARTKRDS
jgi:hypothetical protein